MEFAFSEIYQGKFDMVEFAQNQNINSYIKIQTWK